MIATELIKILGKLPSDVFIETDSGWECDATEVNTAYYSSQKNVLVLTWKPQGNYKYYEESPKWECVFCDVDSRSPVVLYSDF